MIKIRHISKRISAIILSGVVLCTPGCSSKRMETNSDIEIEYNESNLVSNTNKTTGSIVISNIDKQNFQELPGSSLSIINNEGSKVDSWITTNESHQLELSVGKYKLNIDKVANNYESSLQNKWFTIIEGQTTYVTIENNSIKKSKSEDSKEKSSSPSEESQPKNEDSESKDKQVIDFLEKVDDKINNKAYKAKDELVKDYGIIYNFIFNDGKIKNCTFKELKINIQAKVIKIYLKIDDKIESKFPNYKKEIKEKYGDIKTKIKTKLSAISSKLKNYFKTETIKNNSSNKTTKKYIDSFKKQTKKDLNEIERIGNQFKNKIKKYIKNKD